MPALLSNKRASLPSLDPGLFSVIWLGPHLRFRPPGAHYSLHCMLLPLCSFFAYEPILKALQSMRSIPLAQHLLQQLPSSAADSAAGSNPSTAMQSMQAALARPLDPIELPAYLESAARPGRLDLRCLLDKAKMDDLPSAERQRRVGGWV